MFVSGLVSSAIGYKNLSTSRGAGNICWLYTCENSAACIDTYLPREGPETFPLLVHHLVQFQCIDTYLPREGPETKIPIGLLVSKRLEV